MVSQRTYVRMLMIAVGLFLFVSFLHNRAGGTEYTFVDVAESLGVDDSEVAEGAAWIDFDNDGDLDLYVANNGPNRLYQNDGGDFTDVAPALGIDGDDWTKGLAWGDYDNDGDADLFICNADAPDVLFRNDLPDTPTFTDVTSSLSLSDTEPAGPAYWVDFDNDDDLDLYVASSPGNSRLHRNDETAFTDVAPGMGLTGSEGEGISWADYDHDGDMDLFCANYDQPKQLWRNDCSLFVDVAQAVGVDDGGWGRGCPWGDFDNDGDLDLYLSKGIYSSSRNRLYRQTGGSFEDVAPAFGVDIGGDTQGATWLDYDNDGDMDLYLAAWDNTSNRMFRNDDSTFVDVTAEVFDIPNLHAEHSGVVGDYDGDGDLDVYVCNLGQPNRLYRNSGGTRNWLTVHAIGLTICDWDSVSNADGIGATVRVITDDLVSQRRYVGEGGTYYGSQCSLPVEFGLGENTSATIVVEWPSGLVDSIPYVEANQAIEIIEGASTRGDANGDGQINLADAVYLVNYLFIGGPPPDPLWMGDANCSCGVDLADAVYVVNWLFIGGPPPGCP
jgi:hypothetical protein